MKRQDTIIKEAVLVYKMCFESVSDYDDVQWRELIYRHAMMNHGGKDDIAPADMHHSSHSNQGAIH